MNDPNRDLKSGCVQFIVSTACGFLLVFPLGLLFDKMNWPFFHSWGLAHGSFVLAWPMMTLLSFGVFRGILRLRGAKDSKQPPPTGI